MALCQYLDIFLVYTFLISKNIKEARPGIKLTEVKLKIIIFSSKVFCS